jgi:hypothetical protein
MSPIGAISSEIERTNLAVHVDMSLQRDAVIADRIEHLDECMQTLIKDFARFHEEQTNHMAEIKLTHIAAMNAIRTEQTDQLQGLLKVMLGAGASIIGVLVTAIFALVLT